MGISIPQGVSTGFWITGGVLLALLVIGWVTGFFGI